MKLLHTMIISSSIVLSASTAMAQDFSNWSDKTVCRLIKNDNRSDYLEEATRRGLNCEAPKQAKQKQSGSSGASSWSTPDGLDELTVPSNWVPYQNMSAFEEERKGYKIYAGSTGFDGDYGAAIKERCATVMTQWRKAMKFELGVIKEIDMSNSLLGEEKTDMYRQVTFGRCLGEMSADSMRKGKIPEHLSTALIHWANNDEISVPRNIKKNHQQHYYYQSTAAIAVMSAHYAIYYDEYPFNAEERKAVNRYLTKKLKTLNPKYMVDDGRKECNPNNLSRTVRGISKYSIDPNACGSSMWKALVGQIVLGLRLGDEELFKLGIKHTKMQLSYFDKDGIFTTWANKGPNAFHYTAHVPQYLGVLTEIFHTLGYDFLAHKTPSGLLIKDIMGKQIDIYEDPQLLWKYVKLTKEYRGVRSSEYKKWSANKIRRQSKVTYESLVRNMARYVDLYRPELQKYAHCTFDYAFANDLALGIIDNSTNAFNPIDPYIMYKANSEIARCE